MAASLESGVLVSRYSIVGPIGAGGMGEVYKAQDSSLERMVALKILPPDVVRNDERRRRFIQEARSASSLNHPHIVTIHEIGEATVEPSGQVIHYIAMELIDGATLKKKIHQEQTDLRTIVSYLAQAADGLAKAHAAGIVHRDLKPENIMVTRDGFAKVLDFGLAKLSVRKSATETIDTTAVREETREGAVLGTVAYMAPEQVMGKVVDHRCDIFSFGSILYEAATRRRPFEADSDVDVMHKILHDNPQPIEIDGNVPTELRRIIRRCLAKDPERRYQSMKDLAIDLRDLVENYDELSVSATSQGSSSPTAVVAPVAKSNTVVWISAAVAVIALAALGWVYFRSRDGAAQTAAGPAPHTLKIQRLTSSGNVTHARISPDGRYLAMVVRDRDGNLSLRVRQVATGSDVEIAPSSPRLFAGVAFSPDANYVYYARRDEEDGTVGWLYQVPTLGGTARKIAFDVDTAPAFSPDGKQMVFGRGMPQKNENHFVVANTDGSGARVVAAFPRLGAALLGGPAWSPDGKKILAARLRPPDGALASLVEIDAATGATREIGSTEWWWINSVAYQPDGGGVVMTATRKGDPRNRIWLQPLPQGEPRQITNDFNGHRDISVTADGRALTALSNEFDGELHLSSPDDPAGGTPLDNERSSRVNQVCTSATGAIVYTRMDDIASNVMILDGPDAQPRSLTSDGRSVDASISADGKTIVYTSYSKDQAHIWAVDAEGGAPRQITQGAGEYLAEISPDGKTLLYMSKDGLWRRALAGGQAIRLTERPTSSHGFSYDGRLVFYRYWSAAEPSILMRVEPIGGGAPLMDGPGRRGREYRFSPKDDGVTFIAAAGGADNIFLQKLDGSEPVQLTRFKRGGIDSFDWTKDGKLVYIRAEQRMDVVMYTGF